MKGIRILTAAVLIAGLTFLAGCGGGVSGGPGAGDEVAKSSGCVVSSCHGSIASTVTGRAIGEEWRASSHFTRNVAGCTTCHGHSHQNSCSSCHGGGVPQNTAQNGVNAEAKCKECHLDGPDLSSGLDNRHLPELNANFGGTSDPLKIQTYSLTQGWGYPSGVNNPAQSDTMAGWVVLRGTSSESKCIWCHNPHDSRVLPQHVQWGESGHGNPAAGYTRNDMKVRGSAGDYRTQVTGESCVRCHTATGFVGWVESGFTDVRPWGKSTAFTNSTTARTKQTLYCIVCHDNGSGKAYGYNMRSIPAQGAGGGQRIYYNYSAGQGTLINAGANANTAETFARSRIANNFVDYPNIGISDRCLLCHSGRGGGQLIKLAASTNGLNDIPLNFRRNARIGTHDFAGGGTMFRKIGFEYYSSFRYDQPSGIPYRHDQIGLGNFSGTGTRGPCVTCHMSSSESHSYMPVTLGAGTTITSINTSLCSTCHAAGGIGNAFFKGTAADLTTHKTGFAAAIKALNTWLQGKSLSSTSNWLRTESYAAAFTTAGFDQTACTPPADRSLDMLIGSRNMGAAMNIDFLTNDPGAFVHNDLYAKRILYDSIDWLDDCTMNKSAETAINFTNDALFGANVLTPTEITNAVNYLMGTPGSGRPGGN